MNWVQLMLQLISASSGLDVTAAVIVIGLLGAPLTAQVARIPGFWRNLPLQGGRAIAAAGLPLTGRDILFEDDVPVAAEG